ncbi:hypothetical protein Staley_109 [Bacillus phage Staley]|uniref:Uncharacterized protein n=1 Tax=Bacillus phage Staley TaxID=1406792 RepID=U5Q1E6_9CAUD|nr:hypothetical protein Staley_109 [Bacillus phage Staley]AGY48792.1 hypothetical protein Staley_109 [Bacillus phage Staley]
MQTRNELITMEESKLESMFRKELSNFEIMGIEAFLDEWYREYYGFGEEEKATENFLSLAYTSSSSYAMINECGNAEFNELTLSHFALTENNLLVAVCHDIEENYSYFWMN